MGIDRLLDFIVEEFPSPLERGPITVIGKDGTESERPCEPNGPTTAFVFKTVSDPFVGHITMFRVFSGAIRPDTSVHNTTQGTDERIGQLFTQRGKEHESVPAVSAGDIGAVAKLQHAHTGDTFATKDAPVHLPPLELPEPLLAYAIAPKTKGEEDKLATGLARLREEDPTLAREPERGDARDRDARDGRGPSRGDDRATQAQVRGRRRHQSREDRLPGNDPHQGHRHRPARQTERWSRPVRRVRDRRRAPPPR